ncbi:MAG TPA: hypothetical protein VFT72_09855 [Opitutaceae bacterium]|nr:hypothetical protein [Opitutaceae bacterium]
MFSVFRSPLYLLIALLSCGYLAVANQRGWYIFQPFHVAATRAITGPVRHK